MHLPTTQKWKARRKENPPPIFKERRTKTNNKYHPNTPRMTPHLQRLHTNTPVLRCPLPLPPLLPYTPTLHRPRISASCTKLLNTPEEHEEAVTKKARLETPIPWSFENMEFDRRRPEDPFWLALPEFSGDAFPLDWFEGDARLGGDKSGANDPNPLRDL